MAQHESSSALMFASKLASQMASMEQHIAAMEKEKLVTEQELASVVQAKDELQSTLATVSRQSRQQFQKMEAEISSLKLQLDSSTDHRADLERQLDCRRNEMEVLLSTKDASAIEKEKEVFSLRGKLSQKTAECSKLSLELQGRERLMQTLEATMARLQQDIHLLTGRASEQDEAIDRYRQHMESAISAGEGLCKKIDHYQEQKAAQDDQIRSLLKRCSEEGLARLKMAEELREATCTIRQQQDQVHGGAEQLAQAKASLQAAASDKLKQSALLAESQRLYRLQHQIVTNLHVKLQSTQEQLDALQSKMPYGRAVLVNAAVQTVVELEHVHTMEKATSTEDNGLVATAAKATNTDNACAAAAAAAAAAAGAAAAAVRTTADTFSAAAAEEPSAVASATAATAATTTTTAVTTTTTTAATTTSHLRPAPEQRHMLPAACVHSAAQPQLPALAIKVQDDEDGQQDAGATAVKGRSAGPHSSGTQAAPGQGSTCNVDSSGAGLAASMLLKPGKRGFDTQANPAEAAAKRICHTSGRLSGGVAGMLDASPLRSPAAQLPGKATAELAHGTPQPAAASLPALARQPVVAQAQGLPPNRPVSSAVHRPGALDAAASSTSPRNHRQQLGSCSTGGQPGHPVSGGRPLTGLQRVTTAQQLQPGIIQLGGTDSSTGLLQPCAFSMAAAFSRRTVQPLPADQVQRVKQAAGAGGAPLPCPQACAGSSSGAPLGGAAMHKDACSEPAGGREQQGASPAASDSELVRPGFGAMKQQHGGCMAVGGRAGGGVCKPGGADLFASMVDAVSGDDDDDDDEQDESMTYTGGMIS